MSTSTVDTQNPLKIPLQGMETRYIAVYRMKTGTTRRGEPVFREAGEEVPEAQDWSWMTISRLVANGRIREVRIEKRGPGRPRKDEPQWAQ